jgi:hypothetical protein
MGWFQRSHLVVMDTHWWIPNRKTPPMSSEKKASDCDHPQDIG